MSQTDAEIISEEQLDEPHLYKVLLHNDDYTTMDFVVNILCEVFHKTPQEAYEIMMRVHTTGLGLCGIYSREIAEARVNRVLQEANRAGFPLKCTMEEN